MLPQNLVDMLHRSSHRYPSKKALMWKEDGAYRSCTYAELWKQVTHAASGLKKLGVGPNDKVAILSDNSPAWAIADFAILSLGAVVVPIYPTLVGEKVTYILEDCDVNLIFVQNRNRLQQVSSWPQSLTKLVLMSDEVDTSDERILNFSQLLEEGERSNHLQSLTSWKECQRGQLATIVPTSGTTGKPKGVMLSHGNILNNIESMQQFVDVSYRDRTLSFLPLSHIFERTVAHFGLLYQGGTIAYAESIHTVSENLREVQPTLAVSVPRLFEKIYQGIFEQVHQGSSLKKKLFYWGLSIAEQRYQHTAKSYNNPLPSSLEWKYLLAKQIIFTKIHEQLGGRIRLMVSGGAPLNAEICKFFTKIGIPIVEGYGMSECAPLIACTRLTEPRPGTVGRPAPGTEVRLGADNELLAKSPSVMMGYYNLPEKTAETITDGWLHTGDIAEMDGDGCIRIVDRKKSILVLSTGKNVSPQAVEQRLSMSRFIQQSAVIGNNRKYVSALIVPDFSVLKAHAEKHGWSETTPEQWNQSPALSQLIQQEMDRLLKDFASYEKPKTFAILKEPFSADKGELTPTLKIRISQVEKNYADTIATLYHSSDHPLEGAHLTPVAQA
ncbi:long-chain fatty acid--CoA ligase [Mechercharimyces sp. CAU 1602]|uniref:AMP-dependent synthetase/ligase n=1 Tax=Mechercharimyces sp. CAU 1602 TaxID=2973933 RepID=UPI00216315BF|nr:long-chain fatty acid--CoA ligase [Mechercharimyces sp. CAU 1602]MCS1352786.1 long-chain fatty acid--CoA ligase [Mechercharimyces sp. CAU 1602]